MEQKRFRKQDDGFVCANCGLKVLPLGFSSRNHCPRCLCSLHIDNNPGDRSNPCGGLLRPVSVLPDGKKGFVLIQRCERCGEVKRNRAVPDAKVQPDDLSALIRLSAQPAPVYTKKTTR
ncbi:MAG: RNHCP domain-containing protein [Clostridia bacterium]|nr:RNHCP domain-containing protein [Clostridia bacterium]